MECLQVLDMVIAYKDFPTCQICDHFPFNKLFFVYHILIGVKMGTWLHNVWWTVSPADCMPSLFTLVAESFSQQHPENFVHAYGRLFFFFWLLGTLISGL